MLGWMASGEKAERLEESLLELSRECRLTIQTRGIDSRTGFADPRRDFMNSHRRENE